MTVAFPAIGRPIERVEDLRLLRGRGRYVDDLSCKSQLYAVVLRSGVAHGRIRKIDGAAARAMPGRRSAMSASRLRW
jgi:carbon-monoxide dehydrogenase large subunit